MAFVNELQWACWFSRMPITLSKLKQLHYSPLLVLLVGWTCDFLQCSWLMRWCNTCIVIVIIFFCWTISFSRVLSIKEKHWSIIVNIRIQSGSHLSSSLNLPWSRPCGYIIYTSSTSQVNRNNHGWNRWNVWWDQQVTFVTACQCSDKSKNMNIQRTGANLSWKEHSWNFAGTANPQDIIHTQWQRRVKFSIYQNELELIRVPDKLKCRYAEGEFVIPLLQMTNYPDGLECKSAVTAFNTTAPEPENRLQLFSNRNFGTAAHESEKSDLSNTYQKKKKEWSFLME